MYICIYTCLIVSRAPAVLVVDGPVCPGLCSPAGRFCFGDMESLVCTIVLEHLSPQMLLLFWLFVKT